MRISKTVLNTVGILMLTGCATQTLRSGDVEPAQEIAALDHQIAIDSGGDDVDVLAPTDFNLAKARLEEARALQSKNDDRDSVLKTLAEARSHLIRAERLATLSRSLLKDLREARAEAVEMDAGANTAQELDEVDVKYLAIAKAIEDGNYQTDGSDQFNLIQAYRRLALKSEAITKAEAQESADHATEAAGQKGGESP